MAATLLSAAEKEYIEQGVEQDIRNDGRGRLDYRPIEVQLGLIAQASGSARLRLGKTDVVVGVKVRGACRIAGKGRRRKPGAGGGGGQRRGGRRRVRRCGATQAITQLDREGVVRLPACLYAQVEIGNPDPDLPDCGRMAFSVECSPVASSAFQAGAPFWELLSVWSRRCALFALPSPCQLLIPPRLAARAALHGWLLLA